MIVGGDDHTKLETTRVEVIDLEGLTTCDTLPDFPMPKYGATGSLIHNSPVICGDWHHSSSDKRSCYKLINNGVLQWIEIYSMNEERK